MVSNLQHFNPISGTDLNSGGGLFLSTPRFLLNISQTAWARILKFSDFS